MGLFGGGGTATTNTTTTVSPSQYVTNMLEQVANYSQGINPGQFIEKQHAGFTPYQQDALSRMVGSTGLRSLANELAPLTGMGAEIYGKTGNLLEQMAKGNMGITPAALTGFAQELQNNPLTAQSSQAVNNTVASAAGALGASPAASAGATRSLADANATGNLKKQQMYQGMAQGILEGNQKALSEGLRNAGTLGTSAIGAGKKGTSLWQEAVDNELKAGQLQQKEQQAENDTSWENAMGQEIFPWEHADNMLNTLNKISRMAGYTTHNQSKRDIKGNKLGGLRAIGDVAALAMMFI